MIKRGHRGQSLLEYTILIVIIVAAFITMSSYLKRGIQGKWKESLDQLGDQYQPGATNAVTVHRMVSNGETRLQVIPGLSSEGKKGSYTLRSDQQTSRETREFNAVMRY